MGDFLLDFRELEVRRRSSARAACALQFLPDTEVQTLERDSFSLVLSRVDGFDTWGSCVGQSQKGNIMVALAGRIALDEQEWDHAEKENGVGGVACKAILCKYRRGGTNALETLNGNFVAFLHDEATQEFYIVTDRCGMFLAYEQGIPGQSLVFGSHPDVLADAAGESQNWDMGSLAEFLMTSRLSLPYTYYRNIRALEPGTIVRIGLQNRRVTELARSRYFQFDFSFDHNASEDELAEELGNALRNSVRRRTLPRFGCTGIGLSGGLDSRAVLSAVDTRSQIRAFTLFDDENVEYQTAKAIAAACKVELIPLKRDFEFYGNSAELGVRISAGTGCITCNHYLGIRQRLKAEGIANLLTGCYCDYVFKGLALNREETWISRIYRPAAFQFEFYDPFHALKNGYGEEVTSRLKALFPESSKAKLSEQDWAEVERKRIFPLAYEQDLAQRVIPQRVMPWYVPLVDNDVLAAFLKIPPRFKLNGSVFKKMLPVICSKDVCEIPDSNTGCPVNAGWPRQAWAQWSSSLRNRITERLAPRLATRGSWPNWRHYITHSPLLAGLWNRPNPVATEIFTRILGRNPFVTSISEYAARDLVLFQRLFTQKLWLDQRSP